MNASQNGDDTLALAAEADRIAAANPLYAHGACHLLAIALHRLTGRPIQAAVAHDWDIQHDALVHAWIAWEDELAVDVAGLDLARNKLAAYPMGDEAEIVDTDETGLLALVHALSPPPADLEDQIAAARDLARTLAHLAARQWAAGERGR